MTSDIIWVINFKSFAVFQFKFVTIDIIEGCNHSKKNSQLLIIVSKLTLFKLEM